MSPFRTLALLAMPAVVGLGLLSGCGRREQRQEPPPADTTAVAPPVPPDTAVRQPGYRALRIPNARALRALHRELGPERFLMVLKVNRRDSLHVRFGDSLMVPREWPETLLGLSPFPRELPAASDSTKFLLVSRRVQAFAAYERGRLARWGPTSTGRETLQTPAGLYHANWKDRERTSTFNDEWLLRWYVNIENFLGISFHQFDLPGYPASHSCVRLLEDDAIWLYDWVEPWRIDPRNPRVVLAHGTPVVVFGTFAFGRKSPWRKLAIDSTATDVGLSEIERALGEHRTPFLADAEAVAAALASRRAALARDSARVERGAADSTVREPRRLEGAGSDSVGRDSVGPATPDSAAAWPRLRNS